jgi:hypothetical protein
MAERERSREREEGSSSSSSSSSAEPRYGLRARAPPPPPPPPPAAAAAARAPRREFSAAARELLDQEAGATTIGQAMDMADRVAAEFTLTSRTVGAQRIQNQIDRIIERTNNKPKALAQLNGIANEYKRYALALFFLNKEIERQGDAGLQRLSGEIREIAWRMRGISSRLDRLDRSPPDSWSHRPVELTLSDISECNGETVSPISRADFVQGRIIKLSDGVCYSFEDAVGIYNAAPDKNNILSPMTRGPFKENDIQMMRTLKDQGVRVDRGGKTKRKKRTRKTRKNKYK